MRKLPLLEWGFALGMSEKALWLITNKERTKKRNYEGEMKEEREDEDDLRGCVYEDQIRWSKGREIA